jgi:hypothetical protein
MRERIILSVIENDLLGIFKGKGIFYIIETSRFCNLRLKSEKTLKKFLKPLHIKTYNIKRKETPKKHEK